jgi:hypothetical protein
MDSTLLFLGHINACSMVFQCKIDELRQIVTGQNIETLLRSERCLIFLIFVPLRLFS